MHGGKRWNSSRNLGGGAYSAAQGLAINMWCNSGVCVFASAAVITCAKDDKLMEVSCRVSAWPTNIKPRQTINYLQCASFIYSPHTGSAPSLITWWALQMRSRSWRFRNLLTTSAPKVKETPRSFSPQPCTSLSGSDHNRSHSRPGRRTGRRGKQFKEELGLTTVGRRIQLALLMQHRRVTDVTFIHSGRESAWVSFKAKLWILGGKARGSEHFQYEVWACRHTVPVSGTSVGLIILRICSIDCKSGDKPKIEKVTFEWCHF